MKKILQSILLIFAVGAVAYYAWGRIAETPGTVSATASVTEAPATATPEASGQIEAIAQAPETAEPMIVVTYFTTDVRCVSCVTIEQLARAAVEEQFADEVAAGRVRFQMVNLDRPENRHFARDYEMSFKTVVVSEEKSGKVLRWEKRDEVWRLLRAPDQFKAYVAAPVLEFLNNRAS